MKTARVKGSDARQNTPFFVSRTGMLHVRSSEASLESV